MFSSVVNKNVGEQEVAMLRQTPKISSRILDSCTFPPREIIGAKFNFTPFSFKFCILKRKFSDKISQQPPNFFGGGD